jgi:hypothetical protein
MNMLVSVMSEPDAEPRPKTCPECAEQVQVAARVCRFCGYRFDVPLGGGAPAGTGLLARLQRPKDLTTLPELLAGWGEALHEGEVVAAFAACRAGDRDGYLVATDARVLFVTATGERLFEHARRDIIAVRSRGAQLHLAGSGWEVELRAMGRRGEAARLAALLVSR